MLGTDGKMVKPTRAHRNKAKEDENKEKTMPRRGKHCVEEQDISALEEDDDARRPLLL